MDEGPQRDALMAQARFESPRFSISVRMMSGVECMSQLLALALNLCPDVGSTSTRLARPC